MATRSLRLTALEVQKAKTDSEKIIKLLDGGNLYFRVDPNRSWYWIFNYSRPYTDKRNEVSLEDARRRRDEYKASIKKDINPGSQRLQYNFREIKKFIFPFQQFKVQFNCHRVRLS